jgi:hypothetical protein
MLNESGMLYRFLLKNNILDKSFIKNSDIFLNNLEKQEIIKLYIFNTLLFLTKYYIE